MLSPHILTLFTSGLFYTLITSGEKNCHTYKLVKASLTKLSDIFYFAFLAGPGVALAQWASVVRMGGVVQLDAINPMK